MAKRTKIIDLAIHFQTSKGLVWLVRSGEDFGIGKTKSEAEYQALNGGLKAKPGIPSHVLTAGISVAKRIDAVPPMLIVGANSYIRERVPYVLTQLWDIFLTFSPCKREVWRVALVAVHRTQKQVKPVWVHAEGTSIGTVVNDAFGMLLAELSIKERLDAHLANTAGPNANAWFNTWIYRSPKLSLRDLLQLSDYK